MSSRVLLAVDSFQYGGAERHVTDLARALMGRGYEIAVACSADGPLHRDLAGIPVHILADRPVKRRMDACFARRLHHLIREGGVDLVHAHSFASAVALAGCPVPLVITDHSEGGWRDAGADALYGAICREAAAVIAVSEGIAERRAAMGVSRYRLHRIHNAVPFPPVPLRPRQAPTIGVVARLEWEKGVDVFLRAAALLASRASGLAFPLQFVVAGAGSQHEPLRHLTASLGLDRHVRFLGGEADGRALLAHLSILAVPSRSEGEPLVVLEGMGAGLPIVASAAGGIPHQIRHGREGILVPPDDPPALAEALQVLLLERDRAMALGRNARKRVRLLCPFHGMVDAVVEVYERVTAECLVETSGDRAPKYAAGSRA